MPGREKRIRRRAATLAALTVAALITACAGAQANTVQVGSPLTASFTPALISESGPDGTPMTLVQRTLPEPGANATSPVDGTVISYRVAAADGTFEAQVVRLDGPYSPSYTERVFYRGIGSSAPTPISSSGVSSPVATNLAIKRGDWVGIRNFSHSDYIGKVQPTDPAVLDFLDPPLADGGIRPNGGVNPVAEIAIQATVRYCKVPKLNGKSPKGARKALSAADCTVGKLKKTEKVRDRKEVVSQSVKPGKAVSDAKPIKLGLSRKQG